MCRAHQRDIDQDHSECKYDSLFGVVCSYLLIGLCSFFFEFLHLFFSHLTCFIHLPDLLVQLLSLYKKIKSTRSFHKYKFMRFLVNEGGGCHPQAHLLFCLQPLLSLNIKFLLLLFTFDIFIMCELSIEWNNLQAYNIITSIFIYLNTNQQLAMISYGFHQPTCNLADLFATSSSATFSCRVETSFKADSLSPREAASWCLSLSNFSVWNII